ncbi:MAG TPA: acyl carrier protein [Ktedonobacteraceae bacterium]|jgi:acyl carrier protein
MRAFESLQEQSFKEVQQAIVESFEVDSSEITQDTSFKDLEIDSLERVELVVGLEKQLGISLNTPQIQKCATVGNLVDLISAARNN